MRIVSREAGVMLNPIMDIDVRQVEDARLVVPTQDPGDCVRDIPTEGWSEVVVVPDNFIQLFERDVATVPWKNAMIGERVQRRAGAPTVLVSRWDVLRPTPSTDGDLSRCLFGGDEVEQGEAEVGLEEEEDLDEQKSWWGEKRASERVARGQLSFIWLGSLGRRQT